jgi:positive regulator of sigma E activity
MSSFAIYIIGFIVLIVGLSLGASMLGVSTTWIGIGIIVLIGLGIMSAVSRTRRRDIGGGP